jgi:hypothetical protein
VRGSVEVEGVEGCKGSGEGISFAYVIAPLLRTHATAQLSYLRATLQVYLIGIVQVVFTNPFITSCWRPKKQLTDKYSMQRVI